jgi:hypothetical protein
VQTHGLNATQTDIEVNAFYYRCYRVRPKPTSSLFSHHVALPKTTDPTTDDSIPEQEVMRDRYKVNNVLKDRVFDVTFPGDANPTRFVWRKVKDPFDDNSLWNLMLPFYPQQAGGGGDGDNAGPVAINPTFDPQARRASPELSRATSPQPSKQLPPGSAGPVPAPADGQP